MEKQNLTFPARQFKKMHENGKVNFDVLIQRRGNQWSHFNKSKLIQTILEDSYMPAILSRKHKNEKQENVYDIIDGQQRLTTIISYLNDEFALHKDIPSINFMDETYEVAEKSFNELPEELHDQITAFSIVMYAFENATDEEIRELFKRLNSGTPLSADQKMRAEIPGETLSKLDKLLEHQLIEKCAAFSSSQIRKQADQTALLQSMMLLSEYDFKDFSKSSITEFVLHDIAEENFPELQSVFGYLLGAYGELGKQKFMLKVSNMPITIYQANIAMENNITAKDFASWSETFVQEYNPEESGYAQYVGQGSTKKTNIRGKIREMNKHFANHFNLAGNKSIDITETEKVVSIR